MSGSAVQIMLTDPTDTRRQTPARGGGGNAGAMQVELSSSGMGSQGLPLYVRARDQQFGFNDTSTPLGGGGSVTGASRDVNTAGTAYAFFVAEAYADVAGTLFVEKSADSATWYPANGAGAAMGAGATASVKVPLVARYYRYRFVNGAGAQTTFAVFSNFVLN